jgi:hypothetical protein
MANTLSSSCSRLRSGDGEVRVLRLFPLARSWPEALATFFGGQQLRRALVCRPCLQSIEPLSVKIAKGVGRRAFLNFRDLIDTETDACRHSAARSAEKATAGK